MLFSYFLAHAIILILAVFNILVCCSTRWNDDPDLRTSTGICTIGLYAAWLIVSLLDFFDKYNVDVIIEAVK